MNGLRRTVLVFFAASGFAGWLWTGDGDWLVGAALGSLTLALLAIATRGGRHTARLPERRASRRA